MWACSRHSPFARIDLLNRQQQRTSLAGCLFRARTTNLRDCVHFYPYQAQKRASKQESNGTHSLLLNLHTHTLIHSLANTTHTHTHSEKYSVVHRQQNSSHSYRHYYSLTLLLAARIHTLTHKSLRTYIIYIYTRPWIHTSILIYVKKISYYHHQYNRITINPLLSPLLVFSPEAASHQEQPPIIDHLDTHADQLLLPNH